MGLPAIDVFLLSQMAPGILYLLNNLPSIHESVPLPAIGVVILGGVLLLLYHGVKRRREEEEDEEEEEEETDPLFYVFGLFCFTCMVGLTNALEQDGYISGFMAFYVKKGEPHLSTAYAVMMCYWEGVVHYVLFLVMIHHMWIGKCYRSLGLFWAGSSIAHQIIFILGVIIGKYGSNIRPAFFRNMPFLLLPVWGAILLFNRPREMPIIPAVTVSAVQKKSLLYRPLDLVLSLLLIGAMGLCLFRGMVVLDCPIDACFTYIYQYEPYLKDPAGFPKLTMLVYLFYALPLLAIFIYGLRVPGCTWMLDWTIFFAGAIMQTQWCHIGGSTHSRTPFTYRTPADKRWTITPVNLLFAIIPILLVVRCHLSPGFFLTPVSEIRREKKTD